MCVDDITAITGDELRCTKRRKRAMCVYSTCKPGIQPESGDRSARISTGRVEGCKGKGIVQKG